MILNVEGLSSLADYFVICSAKSSRQVRAIADAVQDAFCKEGTRPFGVEGLEESSWVLLDYSDFLLHIFRTEKREFYDIERLWADAPRLSIRLPRTNAAEDKVAKKGGLTV